MQRGNGNPNMVLILVVIVFMILLGFGGSVMRGASYGMGREAAHAMWRR